MKISRKHCPPYDLFYSILQLIFCWWAVPISLTKILKIAIKHCREQVKVAEQMNYILSEQAKTHEGAIALLQMLCISEMLPFNFDLNR
ncbi:MAG: hypothetical protein F6K55_17270 [Moorea sp. SIO4A3]|nr:hypothetical protein [Moorena sp. SIO4A3]